MTERDPKEKKRGADLGFGGLFKGLGDLIERLGELAEKGAELKREGEIGGKKFKGVYGFQVKFGGTKGDSVQVEPFGNVKRDERGGPAVAEEREPLVDVFDEEDCVLVVAELPGVDDSAIKTELSGDLLAISASGRDRRYSKEILLPSAFPPESLERSYRNGVLEIRLGKGTAGSPTARQRARRTGKGPKK
jgi:HSP20 family protein